MGASKIVEAGFSWLGLKVEERSDELRDGDLSDGGLRFYIRSEGHVLLNMSITLPKIGEGSLRSTDLLNGINLVCDPVRVEKSKSVLVIVSGQQRRLHPVLVVACSQRREWRSRILVR